jgi:hypothetical protein
MRPSGRHEDAEREQTVLPQVLNGFRLRSNQRQTEVKSEYRKKAGKLDAEDHQPCNATTFKFMLTKYGKDSEVLGLVVGYSGKAL